MHKKIILLLFLFLTFSESEAVNQDENILNYIENNGAYVEKNIKNINIPPKIMCVVLKKDIFLCR